MSDRPAAFWEERYRVQHSTVHRLEDEIARLREQLDAARPDDIAKFLRARAQSLVKGFYPDWQHVEWLRESADALEALARVTGPAAGDGQP